MGNVWRKTVMHFLVTPILVTRPSSVKNEGTKNKANTLIYSRKLNGGYQYA